MLSLLFSAEHVISNNQDMTEAMSFLQECPFIKIEDILPFFSDVVTIDHFRDPICQSLQVSTHLGKNFRKNNDTLYETKFFLKSPKISQGLMETSTIFIFFFYRSITIK